MSPADMRKEGAAYDLPLAMGILTCLQSNQRGPHMSATSLWESSPWTERVQSIRGALPIAIKALEEGFDGFILPKENAKEAAIVERSEGVRGRTHL